MDQVFQYDIPVLHPLVVHFPVAFILAAALAAIVWLVRDRTAWLMASLYLTAAGLVSALSAYLTGEELEEQSEGVPIVERLVHTHEEAAYVALWLTALSVAVLVFALVVSRRDTRRPGTHFALRLLSTALAVAAATAIVWTGHIGATMVWGVAP